MIDEAFDGEVGLMEGKMGMGGRPENKDSVHDSGPVLWSDYPSALNFLFYPIYVFLLTIIHHEIVKDGEGFLFFQQATQKLV